MGVKRYSAKPEYASSLMDENPDGPWLSVSEIEKHFGSVDAFLVGVAEDNTAPAVVSYSTPDQQIALVSAPGYEQLVQVLRDAHDQAAFGKGKERHANDLPFHEQRMQGISQLLNSPDGMAYQVTKKVVEGLDMPQLDRKVTELLGAINYLAGIVIFLRNRDGGE